jgi:hypothetical protein
MVLWVTNQSFDDSEVVLTITIDGTQLIAEQFDVNGQHTFVECFVKAAPGQHVLSVVSDSGAQLESPFVLPKTRPRYGLITYWNHTEDGTGRLTWDLHTRRLTFA